MARDLTPLAAAERGDLADLLAGLTPEQWAAPSLCAGWSVQDVAAHVVSYDRLGWGGLAATGLRGRLSPDRMNEVALAPYRAMTPQQVLEVVRETRTPRGLVAARGGRIALTDGLIHHQDVRRALGLPRDVPADRVRPALAVALAAPVLPARKQVRGLRLSATDLDWTHGPDGADVPEVAGPGEALLLAVAGRPHALRDLTGDGVEVLRARLS